VILTRFPPPPRSVLHMLDLLEVLRRGNADEMNSAGDLTDLPRPWDPTSCPDDLRADVWGWCDAVAAWLNQEYAWRPTQMIPPCWPRHPHIARELPVLAFLRFWAGKATGPEPMEEWHRYSFPAFCERMFTRLGESTCRTGKHIAWPAQGRDAAYTEAATTENRQAVIYADTHPPIPLHTVRRS